ncbi:MAG: TraR/DksA family transcriptional regulator [Dissulfurispiraceae bacterium]|jgi:DnaK suppressor protein
MVSKVAAETRHDKFQKMLLIRRAEVIKLSLADLKAALSGEGKSVDVGDEGDIASDSYEALLRGNLTASRRKAVINIDEALRRLDDGSYGLCEECGDEIPENRLKANPFAIRCIDCQEEVERRLKHEGGDITVDKV